MSIRLLEPTNTTFNLNFLNAENILNLRFGILDYSDPKAVDYFFSPIVMLDKITIPSADLRIGGHRMQIPLDWSILVGDKEYGDLEIIPVEALNDRGFSVFAFNPLDGFKPHFLDIEIVDVYPDQFWQIPRLKFGCMLLAALHDQRNQPVRSKGEHGPLCVFLVKDLNKLPDTLDIGKLT